MAVKVILSRKGRINRSFYRVVALDSRKATDSRFLEILGWYDPEKTGVNYELKLDKIEKWTRTGAHLSDTVRSLVKKATKARDAAAKAAPAAVTETAAPVAPAEAQS